MVRGNARATLPKGPSGCGFTGVTTIAVGIDLASSPEYGATRYNRLGLAALDSALRATTAAGRLQDSDIIGFVEAHRPRVVAIDSPLSLPAGRCCADPACRCARFGIVRAVDRAIARMGHHPYWPLLQSMAPLTLRGIALRRELAGRGFDVIEVFPGGVQDVLGIARKQRGRDLLAAGLRRLGIEGELDRCSADELDAITAAFAGYLYTRGACIAVGPEEEVQVIYPAPASEREAMS